MESMNFTALAYRAVRATRTMGNMPRFNHRSDFSSLFSDDSEVRKDYTLGLLFAGSFVLAVFLAWSISLLFLKCLGPKKVGFLSGHTFTTTKSSRPFYVRLVFANAGVFFIVFTILLVTQGITNLRDSVDVVSTNNFEVRSLLAEGKAISTSLEQVGRSSQGVRDELVANLGNFCPGEPNVESITGFDFDELAGDAIALLNELDDFIDNDLDDFQRGLDTAKDAQNDVDEYVDQIDVNDWQSLLILIPYVIVPSLMLVGAMMAWYNVAIPAFTCALSWVFLPLLCLLTCFAYVMCALVAFAAVANADLCSGGTSETPDETFLEILNVLDVDQDSTLYRAVLYYLSQCMAEDPWLAVRSYDEEIMSAEATVQELAIALETVTVAELNNICNKDFAPFEQLLATMENNLSILRENTEVALGLLSCENIVPIYQETLYSGTCTYSITGATWTFAAFLVIAFMGMIMIMFRASYLEDQGEDTEEDLQMAVKEAGLSQPVATLRGPMPTAPPETFCYYSDDESDLYLDTSHEVSFDESPSHQGRGFE